MLLTEKWIDKVLDVKQVSDRLITFTQVIDKVLNTNTISSVYTQQSGLTSADKELLYDNLQSLVRTIYDSEIIVCKGVPAPPLFKAPTP